VLAFNAASFATGPSGLSGTIGLDDVNHSGFVPVPPEGDITLSRRLDMLTVGPNSRVRRIKKTESVEARSFFLLATPAAPKPPGPFSCCRGRALQ
jgi:hypothetical protein